MPFHDNGWQAKAGGSGNPLKITGVILIVSSDLDRHIEQVRTRLARQEICLDKLVERKLGSRITTQRYGGAAEVIRKRDYCDLSRNIVTTDHHGQLNDAHKPAHGLRATVPGTTDKNVAASGNQQNQGKKAS
jgi:hypothetical protein